MGTPSHAAAAAAAVTRSLPAMLQLDDKTGILQGAEPVERRHRFAKRLVMRTAMATVER